jgi:hypothetical protein
MTANYLSGIYALTLNKVNILSFVMVLPDFIIFLLVITLIYPFGFLERPKILSLFLLESQFLL